MPLYELINNRSFAKALMKILLVPALLVVILPLILVYVNTHPPRYPYNIPPSVYKAWYEDVSFASEDGTVLKGWLVRPSHPASHSPAIIVCHGLGANKSDFTELAVSLSKRGYFVLQFDFRAHGDSGGSRTSLGYHEQEDVAAALAFLKSRPGIDPKRIGIYGFSMGASTAILAAAKTGAFRAIVADSAFARLRDLSGTVISSFYHLPSFPFLNLAVLGYDLYFQTSINNIAPVTVIAGLSPVPILIIAGDSDTLVPVKYGHQLFEAAKEPKELWIIRGADHGGTLAVAGREYEKRVGEFFDRNLKGSLR
jgi:dipeptidyl aminopeptidase/acylaminoacyl peptidase